METKDWILLFAPILCNGLIVFLVQFYITERYKCKQEKKQLQNEIYKNLYIRVQALTTGSLELYLQKNKLSEFGAGSTKKQYTEQSFDIAKEVFKNCLDIRRICSSALAIAYVAAGKLNGYFERNIKPWDYAAATLMLEECGGMCSDWNGIPIQYEHQSSFVCGTPKAYEFLMDTIKRYSDN